MKNVRPAGNNEASLFLQAGIEPQSTYSAAARLSGCSAAISARSVSTM